MAEITWDSTTDGYAAFLGPLKVCTLTTKHDQGWQKNGQIIWEAMPREHWSIHWTAAGLNLALVEAVIASLPKEASPTPAPARPR